MRKLSLLLAVLCMAPPAFGMFMNLAEPVPVERLVTNLTEFVRAHPDDAKGYYTLGRIHAMAFSRGQTISVIPETKSKTGLPGFAAFDSIIIRRNGSEPPADADRNHLLEAIRNYRKAAELAPETALTFLGLGWELEMAAKLSSEIGVPPGKAPELTADEKTAQEKWLNEFKSEDPTKRESATRALIAQGDKAIPLLQANRENPNAEIRSRVAAAISGVWAEQALNAYRKAFELALPADLKRKFRGPAADSQISSEAGGAIVRLLKAQGATDVASTEEIARVNKTVAELNKSGMAVTPIIFSLDHPAALDELLDPKHTTGFDLAGDGISRQWPWVKPATAILVWDPRRTGKITSGRQLFGSATWWMFWGDGYGPLAMLDDNRDGFLSGDELRGLAVWRDSNGNGVSDPGEVRPVEAAGIERIAVNSAGQSCVTLYNSHGIQLKGGRYLPTYDWTPTSIAPAQPVFTATLLKD